MPRLPLPSLPPEIILEIFTRLPAKCIGRYRSLSKSWRQLLSELHFINRHIARTRLFNNNELFMLTSTNFNTLYSGTIVRHSYGEITVLATELNFVVSPKCRVWETSSCDGLILLIQNAKSESLLVNPTTKEVRELNIPSHDLDVYPRETTCGLGYDHVNDDYKVVALSSYSFELQMSTNVFSVRNGSWKQVESSPYHHISPGVFVGGSIHWIALNPSDYLNFGNPASFSYVIAGFDLTTEKFWKLPAPSSMFDGASGRYNLGILGECLCMFSSVSEKKINIWVMKEYGVMQSWTKFSIVDEQGSNLKPLKGVMGQQELVMLMLKDDYSPYESFSMYNLNTAAFQDMKVKGVNGGVKLGWSFKETLVSPYYKQN